jgi:hypothetical protein
MSTFAAGAKATARPRFFFGSAARGFRPDVTQEEARQSVLGESQDMGSIDIVVNHRFIRGLAMTWPMTASPQTRYCRA